MPIPNAIIRTENKLPRSAWANQDAFPKVEEAPVSQEASRPLASGLNWVSDNKKDMENCFWYTLSYNVTMIMASNNLKERDHMRATERGVFIYLFIHGRTYSSVPPDCW